MILPLLSFRRLAGTGLTLALIFLFSTRSLAQRWDFAQAVGTSQFNGTAQGSKTITDAAGNVYVTGTFQGSISLGGRLLISRSFSSFIAKYDAAGQCLWLRQTSLVGAQDLAVDASGDLYLTGAFTGTSITLGTTTLTNTSSSSYSSDVFVAKLSGGGQWLWAVQTTGPGSDAGSNLTLDPSGNVYVAGSFGNSLTVGSTTLTSTSYDLFVAKLSPGGQFVWAAQAGSENMDYSTGLAVDASGSAYLTGSFYGGSATFGSSTVTNTNNVAGSGVPDVFVARLTPAGQWQWAVKAGGTSQDAAASLALDPSGNVYVTGTFSYSATFGPTTLTTPNFSSYPGVFVAKLSGSGQWLWASKAGSTGGASVSGLAVDGNGQAYVAGSFSGSSFSAGAFTVPITSSANAYVAQISSSGQWLWATGNTGGGEASIQGLAVGAANNVYLAGYFRLGNVTLGATPLANSGASDLLLARLSSSGQWLWAQQSNDGGSTTVSSTATDAAGNVYTAGSFTGTVAFGSISLTSTNRAELFVAKRSAAGQWLWATQATGRADFSPGYNGDKQTLALDGSGNVYLTGNFAGPSATFGSSTLTSTSGGYSGYDVFVAKLNGSGQWLWAARGGSADDDYANGLAVDGSGNAYLTGLFQGSSASFGGTTLSNSGPTQTGEAFVAKISAAGQWLWATAGGGTTSDYATALALDNAANAYVTGSFYGPAATFGAHTVSTTDGGSFVAKVSAAGQWLWATASSGGSTSSIAVDATGSSYVAGGFRSLTTFGSITLSSTDTADVFVAKLDPTGQWLWATMGGTRGLNTSNSIAVDGNGSAIISGGFRSAGAVFGSTTLPYSHSSYLDTFVARLTPAGQWQWAASAGGTGYISTLTQDGSGGAYVVGSFGGDQGNGSATFGPLQLTGSGPVHSTGFLAHISNLATATAPARVPQLAQVFPNPFQQSLTVQLARPGTPVELTVCDATGRLRLHKSVPAGSAQANMILPEAAQWPAGLYLLTIRQGQQVQVLKVVRQ